MIGLARRAARKVQKKAVQAVRPAVKVFAPSRLRSVIGAKGEHLFIGYYDIDPFLDDRIVLAHRVRADDGEADIGVCDISTGAFRPLATTACWSWQLGARLQMLDDERLVFNTLENGRPAARIIGRDGGRMGMLPFNIFAFDAARSLGATLDFGRLYRHRSGYGYRVLADRKGSGIEAIDRGIGVFDVKRGDFVCAIDVEAAWNEAVRRNVLPAALSDAPRYLNHPLFSACGAKIAFVLVVDGARARKQALMVADAMTGAILGVMPMQRQASHFWWVGPDSLSVFVSSETGGYAGRYMNWDIARNSVEESGPVWPQVDGHQTNHSRQDWWMTDTYPDRYGFQHLYALKEANKGERILIGRFRATLGMGPNKCDLHPRRSAEGSLAAIDTAYDGYRHIAIIDLRLSGSSG